MPIYFTRLIRHGKDRLQSEPLPLRRRKPYPQGLSIRTYNICNRRGFRLAQAIWEVQVRGFDHMVLTETKVTDQA